MIFREVAQTPCSTPHAPPDLFPWARDFLSMPKQADGLFSGMVALNRPRLLRWRNESGGLGSTTSGESRTRRPLARSVQGGKAGQGRVESNALRALRLLPYEHAWRHPPRRTPKPVITLELKYDKNIN